MAKKKATAKRPKRKTSDEVWFNAVMRMGYRRLADLEDENERLRREMGLPSRR